MLQTPAQLCCVRSFDLLTQFILGRRIDRLSNTKTGPTQPVISHRFIVSLNFLHHWILDLVSLVWERKLIKFCRLHRNQCFILLLDYTRRAWWPLGALVWKSLKSDVRWRQSDVGQEFLSSKIWIFRRFTQRKRIHLIAFSHFTARYHSWTFLQFLKKVEKKSVQPSLQKVQTWGFQNEHF